MFAFAHNHDRRLINADSAAARIHDFGALDMLLKVEHLDVANKLNF